MIVIKIIKNNNTWKNVDLLRCLYDLQKVTKVKINFSLSLHIVGKFSGDTRM